jgi:hypothetical protein
MKKFITLLLAISFISAANAQSRKIEEARRVVNGQPQQEERRVYDEQGVRYPDSYPVNNSSEIDRVNRDYDYKIQSIRNNPNLNSEEKARIIRQLEKDREKKIRSISKSYNDDDKKKYKSNNGKHKGWTKGKGNQKKNRD